MREEIAEKVPSMRDEFKRKVPSMRDECGFGVGKVQQIPPVHLGVMDAQVVGNVSHVATSFTSTIVR